MVVQILELIKHLIGFVIQVTECKYLPCSQQTTVYTSVVYLFYLLTVADTEDIFKTYPNMFCTAEQASAEFAILLHQILKELKKNEGDNLELLKIMSSTLTVKDKSGVRIFSDSELEGIQACENINTLLTLKLRHCYRWDDHSILTVLMSSLNAEKCTELLESFQEKISIKIKLKEIYEHCLKEISQFPEGYHKMVAIVDKKIFSSITKEEYDELKQFISQHCGVEPYVMSPFSKASPFSSVVFEWFIPVITISYMIKTARSNVCEFTKKILVYLKISSTVIFDHRNNVSTGTVVVQYGVFRVDYSMCCNFTNQKFL